VKDWGVDYARGDPFYIEPYHYYAGHSLDTQISPGHSLDTQISPAHSHGTQISPGHSDISWTLISMTAITTGYGTRLSLF